MLALYYCIYSIQLYKAKNNYWQKKQKNNTVPAIHYFTQNPLAEKNLKMKKIIALYNWSKSWWNIFVESQLKFSKSCCNLVIEDTDNLCRVVVITDAVWWTQKHDDQNVQQVPGPERTEPGGWSCKGISVVIMYKFWSAF